jgi:small membrane protein
MVVQMIIKILLSLVLLALLIYVYVQPLTLILLRSAVTFIFSLGVYFVWFPDQSTRIAELIGVGRGADLLLYCLAMATLVVVLIVHLKLKRMNAVITQLARHVAKQEAFIRKRGM